MREPEDLTGRRFGKLTVISQAEPYTAPSGTKRYVWNCVCDCGNKCVVRGDYLRKGQKLHCRECKPIPKTGLYEKMCRNCEHSKRSGKGEWLCLRGYDTSKAKEKCEGFWCGRTDKLTGVKHRETKCFVCGKPVYSNGNDIAIYCEEHKDYAKLDNKMLNEASMEVLFEVIAGIFARARDDYLLNTDGNRKDAEEFFRSEWARELSMWNFDADTTIKSLNEEISNGLE